MYTHTRTCSNIYAIRALRSSNVSLTTERGVTPALLWGLEVMVMYNRFHWNSGVCLSVWTLVRVCVDLPAD